MSASLTPPFTSPTNPRVTNPKLLHPQIHLMLESWPRKVICQQQRKRKHNSFDRSKSSILILRLQGSIQSNPENLFVLVLKNFWWQILAASNSQILDWQECQPGVRGGDQSPDYENWELFEYFNIRETVLSTYQGDLFKHAGCYSVFGAKHRTKANPMWKPRTSLLYFIRQTAKALVQKLLNCVNLITRS